MSAQSTSGVESTKLIASRMTRLAEEPLASSLAVAGGRVEVVHTRRHRLSDGCEDARAGDRYGLRSAALAAAVSRMTIILPSVGATPLAGSLRRAASSSPRRQATLAALSLPVTNRMTHRAALISG